jgi:hypothetical protein
MRTLLLLVFSSFYFLSGNYLKNGKIFKSLDIKISKIQNDSIDCNEFWETRFPNDTTKSKLIDKIITKSDLTKNNQAFLNDLKSQNKYNTAYEKTLSPIFRRSKSDIGIFSFPYYKEVGNTFVATSKEIELMKKYGINPIINLEQYGNLIFYPKLIDSIFSKKPKPQIFYYTDEKIGTTSIKLFGAYEDECLIYHEYIIDETTITLSDKVLFSSPFKIDLIFESSRKINDLLKNDYSKKCFDCPNSLHLQKTFARLKGTKNVYFVYADTFPINDQLDTPSRALIHVSEDQEITYLWYEEVDLFGCSCL